MNMRIAWAGPWNKSSSVAAFGEKVVEELLTRGHAVTVLRTEIGRAARRRSRSTLTEVRDWNPTTLFDLLRNVDAVVVNFANDYLNCGAMLDSYHTLGAVGIFHDATLDRLASAWNRTLPEPRAASEAMGNPLSWFAAGLAGALVFDPVDLERVSQSCPGAVQRILASAKSGQTQDVNACVDSLLRLLPLVFERRPTILTAQSIGRVLTSFGLEQSDPSVSDVTHELNGLFDAHE